MKLSKKLEVEYMKKQADKMTSKDNVKEAVLTILQYVGGSGAKEANAEVTCDVMEVSTGKTETQTWHIHVHKKD